MRASAASLPASPPQDFSLVVGGPLFQLLRRLRLSDEVLGFVHRRIIAAILIMWAPLLALSAAQGALVAPGRPLPFANDIGFHLRFLVAAPLLIIAEPIVHLRMRLIISQFRIRGLVPPREAGRFADALTEATRLRNSMVAEALLLVFVYAVGIVFAVRRYETLGGGAWFAAPDGGGRLSPAGLWLVFVSLPLLQFLLLRWYFRLFIWARFLWRMSRIDLNLNATHPDKAAGLGFLGESLFAFVPIAAAHGVLFAGSMADRIFYAGAKLTDFQLQVAAGALVLLVVFAGPLTIFAVRLARVKRLGLLEYGAVGQTYVQEFRDKWMRGGAPADEPLIGSGDIQSLADLGNSYGGAEQMRMAPIAPRALLYFLASFLAPILPLILTTMSIEKLVSQLIGLVL
jgi:hypothetical protein